MVGPSGDAAGQGAAAAAAAPQTGTPASFASTPFGRVTSTLERFCSPERWTRSVVKVEKAPAIGLTAPAESDGENPGGTQF